MNLSIRFTEFVKQSCSSVILFPMEEAEKQISELIQNAHKIVIIQADNPDADSLGSALALEHILGDMGKGPLLQCGVDMPGYLHYLSGWDRVQKDLPAQFDASIIVDASTLTLLEKLEHSGQRGWLASKPCLVLDHHGSVANPIPFASVTLNDPSASSTGELIYNLAKQLGWPLSVPAQELLMSAILGDTQGLSNFQTHPETYRIVADMIDAGVDRPALEEKRREYSKMPPAIFKYKARLIEHTELYNDDTIAIVTVPQAEINEFSPLYNPKILIQGEMQQISGVRLSIVLKAYDNGRITGAIRGTTGSPLADKLAEHFGGGGHAYASGFKISGGRTLEDIKSETIRVATELLDKLKEDKQDE